MLYRKLYSDNGKRIVNIGDYTLHDKGTSNIEAFKETLRKAIALVEECEKNGGEEGVKPTNILSGELIIQNNIPEGIGLDTSKWSVGFSMTVEGEEVNAEEDYKR